MYHADCPAAHRRAVTALTGLVLAVMTAATPAQERNRVNIPDKYKWDLTDLYPSNATWRAAKDRVAAELPQIGHYKGRLDSSPGTLADALDLEARLSKELSRLSTYANLLADQDTRDATHQGMRQEMTLLWSTFGEQAAYIAPETLRLGKERIEAFLSSEPRLSVYRFDLEELLRQAAHTLNDSEEALLAATGTFAGAPSTTYSMFSDADFPYPTVTLSTGREVKVDWATFTDLRALPDRADREKVMSVFFDALGAFSRTYGTTMDGQVQTAWFFAKARNYASSLERALDRVNVPMSVYARLIEGMNRHLPTFHRYLALRTRMMGVEQLHYYDLYAPLVASVNLTYTPEEAQAHVLASVAPLGEEYQRTIQHAFDNRWLDWYPSDGKTSGAYSSGGAYDVHPYMLLNYNGQYTDVSTLTHELGHTMQSYLSNRTQPYPLADYPIFVAEVASTFNEALLIDHMLANVTDDDTKLSILGNHLENIKGTVFRQTQFAEFELRMHEMAQEGTPLTGDTLSKLYMDITKRYYGHDQGVCIVDAYVAHEWSYIPHFYNAFYVYQYATSFTASAALAAAVKTGGPEARARYLAFLSAGGSKAPIDLLKDAGVDMTTDEPLTLTIAEMNRVMDEMEAILARRGAAAGAR